MRWCNKVRLCKDITLSFFMAVILTIFYEGYLFIVRDNPYKDVVVVEFTHIEGGYYLEANFTKTKCEFEELYAFGKVGGEWVYFDWEPLNGDRGDRPSGEHTLQINILTGKIHPDLIEIRTRHDCDGKRTDRIFTTQDVET